MAPDAERDAALHERLEARLAAALCSQDPGAALSELRADAELSSWLAGGLQHAREDGFRIAALLVARLRFERLLHGSRAAAALFDADPRAFAERFRRYHAQVPPRALLPAEEAAQFQAWVAGDASRARPGA